MKINSEQKDRTKNILMGAYYMVHYCGVFDRELQLALDSTTPDKFEELVTELWEDKNHKRHKLAKICGHWHNCDNYIASVVLLGL